MDRFRNKQAAEAYYIEFDFDELCGTATVSSATVAAKVVSTGVDATATITTVASQSISGTSVYVWVKAGTAGTDYQITCTATASDGSIYELEGLMLVIDIPPAAVTGTGPGLVIAPVIEPISLADIKAHIGIDSTDEDELLKTLIVMGRQHVEDITRRALLTQTHDFCLQDWPAGDFIRLPYGNLQTSGLSVKWKDDDGTETTLTLTTDYLIETNGEQCGKIVLPYGESWPSGTLYPSNPITIRFACGWTTAALIPWKIKTAVKFAAEDVYYHGDRHETLEKIIQTLLASYRLWNEF